jgi:hypothetical protein
MQQVSLILLQREVHIQMMRLLPVILLDADTPPEWAGWLGLIILVATFGLLAWWLFSSHLPQPVKLAAPTGRVVWVHRLMAGVVLLSGLLLRVGAPWDELWHRLYGVPFGEDLLWPPHLFIYASFVLSAFLVAYGLAVAVRGEGSLRARFRREPLLALLGLFAAYKVAFIPVDLIWHAAIGPDLVAESPPHVFGALADLGVPLTGVALALSTVPRPAWRSLVDRPRAVDIVALDILALLILSWLQLFTTGWEWRGDTVPGRSGWIYLVTVLVIGAVFAHLALYATRRIGAATAITLAALAIHVVTVAVFRLYLPPGPIIAAHLVLLPPAVVLDAWYALRLRNEATTDCASCRTRMTHWGGALLYTAVFIAIAIPFISRVMIAPALNLTTVLASVAVGLPAALIASLASMRIGTWLGEAGREPTASPTPATLSPSTSRAI